MKICLVPGQIYAISLDLCYFIMNQCLSKIVLQKYLFDNMFREDVSFDILELHAYVFKNSKSFL